MFKEKATTGIYLDKRRKNKKGEYPVKLRITFQRRSKLYATSYSFTEDDFNTIRGKSPRNENKDTSLELAAIEKHASEIIDSIREFTFESFEHKFLNSKNDLHNVIYYFQKQIDLFESNQQFGSASSYTSAKLSFIEFKGENIPFSEITPKFLTDFEKSMLKNEKSITTVSIYCRSLRRIINNAIYNGDAKKEAYPFGRMERGQYSIPESRNIKKGLKLSDLKKIYLYKSKPGTPEQYFKDLWIFSYLSSGLNMKDICQLKYINIHDDSLHIERAKTSGRKRDKVPISIIMTKDTEAIINKWGNTPRKPETYIFPILNTEMLPKRQYYAIKQFTKQVNKYIKRVAEELGIKENLSSTYARHSYATVLKNSDVSLAFVSEQLGHSSIKTTENYLGSFENKAKKDIVKKLTDF